ncbi:MAG: hypothetical protein Q4F97_12100 [Bacteroidales bacterium]|nr:hypothetical protein [Bacteroidales bacterium]
MILNYLYFKGVELGIRTKSYSDYPIIGGAATVTMFVIFNFSSLLLLAMHFFNFKVEINSTIMAVVVYGSSLLYYYFKGEKIVAKYESKRFSNKLYNLHPVIPVMGLPALAAGIELLIGYFFYR